MEIIYLGHSSFLIKTKKARVVIDPFDPQMVGLKFSKIKADIVTVSHNHHDHNRTDLIEGEPLIINLPGRFEKQEVKINGYSSFHDKNEGAERGKNILFKFTTENISILHCGDLGMVPKDNLFDKIGNVDILMLPVGGFYTISPQEAVQVVKKLEPALVLPMHYNQKGLNKAEFSQLAPVETFLKEMNVSEDLSWQDELVIKKTDLPEEITKIILLSVRN